LARTSVDRDSRYIFALNSSEFTSYETVTLTGDFFDDRGELQMTLSAVPPDRVYAGDFMFESAETMSMQTVHGTRGNALYFDGRVKLVDLRRPDQR
jgi:prepilin-type processing-associated H-X9-DG protein